MKHKHLRLDFTKMTGAGNDFVVIDNRSGNVRNGSILARRICDRRWGVGADGLLLLEKSKKAAYRMMYYNSDGSYGGMCGNGGRCISWYAYNQGIAAAKHTFEALDHVYAANANGQEVALKMKNPKDFIHPIRLNIRAKRVDVASVDTGAPHVVVLSRDLMRGRGALANLDVQGWGRLIRHHRKFYPKGTNVNFVELIGRNSIEIRTYERGVEDETLACGTGSIASAIVGYKLWGLKPPVNVIPRSKKKLVVRFDPTDDKFENVELVGPAVVVFTGSIDFRTK